MDPLRRRINTIGDDALGDSDVVELRERLRRRQVSPAELRAAALARADAAQGLNAVVQILDPPVPGDGPFAGIPLPIKDNEDVAGAATTWGSFAMGSRPAERTSAFVQQLMDLGFAPLLKTTMPEFGLTASTQSRRFGNTRNPWDTSRTVGGSSGGSAALVAAGVVPMAHSNDGGGSSRIPAAACGLVGLKPSRGRLIDRPELAQAPIPLFTQGVITRTVRDTAAFYAEVERLYHDPALPPIGEVAGPSGQRLRIGLVASGLSGIPLSPEVIKSLDFAAGLCERLGHEVEYVESPHSDQMARDFLRYWTFIAFSLKNFGQRLFGGDFDGSRVDNFAAGLAAMARANPQGIPPAIRRLRRIAARPGPIPAGLDVLLGPVMGHAPPTLDWFDVDVDFRTHLVRLLRFVTSTPMENVTGAPAISLPLARTAEGVPLGVQFTAPIGAEATLLELAYELEAAAPWPLGAG